MQRRSYVLPKSHTGSCVLNTLDFIPVKNSEARDTRHEPSVETSNNGLLFSFTMVNVAEPSSPSLDTTGTSDPISTQHNYSTFISNFRKSRGGIQILIVSTIYAVGIGCVLGLVSFYRFIIDFCSFLTIILIESMLLTFLIAYSDPSNTG